MRFSIFQILLLMLVIALCVAAYRSREALVVAHHSLAIQQLQLQEKLSEIDSFESRRPNFLKEALIDEGAEYEDVYQSVLPAFEAVQQKYSQLTSVPNRLAYRVVPTLGNDLSFRFLVPAEFPVYLRVGIQEKLEDRVHLDEASWDLFPAWQIQLPTSEQRLLVRYYGERRYNQVRIELNDKLLHIITLPSGYAKTGHSHTSGAEQLNFARDNLATFLALNFQNQRSSKPELAIYFWNSAQTIDDRFMPLPSLDSESQLDVMQGASQ